MGDADLLRLLSSSMKNKKAVVLLSGGLDSATTLYLAKKKGFRCFCLIFDYGQRHKREIESAIRIAQRAGCKFQIVNIKLPWKGSALLDKRIALPRRLNLGRIPPTYVPARNTIFLSFALSFAEAVGAYDIFIGANAVDFSGYPDCRPTFYNAFQSVIKSGTKAGALGKRIKIQTPLINRSKAQIIRLALTLNIPLKLTWSCYKGKNKPCGTCDSCRLRAKGFKEAKIKDPILNGD